MIFRRFSYIYTINLNGLGCREISIFLILMQLLSNLRAEIAKYLSNFEAWDPGTNQSFRGLETTLIETDQ